MSLFWVGLGLTAAAPVLRSKRYRLHGPAWMYSLGCGAAVLGPYILLCTFLDVATLLAAAAIIGVPFWGYERYRAAKGQQHYTQGIMGYMVELTPVAVFLLLFRSFVAEPYLVPSSSMRPTLEVGSVVVVDKFSYGVRLPFVSKPISHGGAPKFGDVLVFRFPLDPAKPYIKRVVGVPGDNITYQSGELSINGAPAVREMEMPYDYEDEASGKLKHATYTLERIQGLQIDTLQDNGSSDFGVNTDFPAIPGCVRNVSGISCVVPKGSYFVLGDNRSNSLDSRYWGFVTDKEIIGRAIFDINIDNGSFQFSRLSR